MLVEGDTNSVQFRRSLEGVEVVIDKDKASALLAGSWEQGC